MTSVPSESAEDSSAARAVPGRVGQTVQMNPAILGQAANTNPLGDTIRQLEMASALLGDAVTYGETSPPPSGSGEPAVRAEPTIEEYMAALIARTKSVRSSEAPRGAGEVIEAARSAAARSAVERRETAFAGGTRIASDASEDSAAAEVDSAAGRQRKQAAPTECRETFSELRELANVHAHSTFDLHRGQQIVCAMHNKLVVLLVALVVSFALINLSSSMRSPAYFAAVTALIIAMAWTVEYFQLGRQLACLCLRSESNQDRSS